VTSDKKGVVFTIDVADTLMDTAYVQANVTSVTTASDSFPIANVEGQRSLHASVLIDPNPAGAADGVGNDDSGYIWLYGMFLNDRFADTWKLLDSHRTDGLPTTLTVRLADDVGDTLLEDQIWLKWNIYDSCTDANDTLPYTLRYGVTLY